MKKIITKADLDNIIKEGVLKILKEEDTLIENPAWKLGQRITFPNLENFYAKPMFKDENGNDAEVQSDFSYTYGKFTPTGVKHIAEWDKKWGIYYKEDPSSFLGSFVGYYYPYDKHFTSMGGGGDQKGLSLYQVMKNIAAYKKNNL